MRLVLVHGFTQTPTSWSGVVEALRALTREGPSDVVTPLIRPAVHFDQTVAQLALDGGPGTWCGYSMGGRLALGVALTRPELVEHLVLVSATAGLANADDRAARVAADEVLAQSIESDGVDAFLSKWLTQPMFATVPANAPGVDDRHSIGGATLASHLRHLGTGTMPNLWDRLRELRMPVTIVSGALDAKFSAIALQMHSAIKYSKLVTIDSGHSIPLENPLQLARAILAATETAP